jgi:hypothetical protein
MADETNDETSELTYEQFKEQFAVGRANVREFATICAMLRADELLARLNGAADEAERLDILRETLRGYERTMRDLCVVVSIAFGLLGNAESSLEYARISTTP